MKKRLLACLLSAALLLTCCLAGLVMPAAAAPVDLLGDGDFESETLSNHWKWNHTKYSILHDTASPIKRHTEDDGNNCLKFPPVAEETDTGTTYSSYTKYIGSTPIVIDRVYRVTFRYKGSGLKFRIESAFLATGKSVAVTLPAAADWTPFTYVFKTRETKPFEAVNTAIGFVHADTDGIGYIDDVQLFEVIQPQSIAFTKSTVMLSKGASAALSVAVQPADAELDGDIKFTSGNTAVATVNANGVVTAVSAGVANITATVGDLSATCAVIVDRYAPVLLGDFEGASHPGWESTSVKWGIINPGNSPATVHLESDGNHCLYLPANGSDDGTGNITYTKYEKYLENMPVKGNTTYVLSFRGKGTAAKVHLNSGSCSSGSGSIAPSTDTWKTYTKTFTTKAEPSVSFTLGIIHDAAAGDCYIDDVTLTEVSPFQNLMLDGDLQAGELSSHWGSFTAENNAAYVSHVRESENSANLCLKITGNKAPNYKLDSIEKSTYYRFSFRYKGSGTVVANFDNTYVVDESIKLHGTDNYQSAKVASSKPYDRYFIYPETEWQTVSFVFKTGTDEANKNWTLQFGSNGTNSVVYLDDFSLEKIGSAYAVEGLAGGTVTISDGASNGALLSGLLSKTVTATVTPNAGYLMVPGSLRYITADGMVQRILNKPGAFPEVFGQGEGNTFAFNMPTSNIRVLADFVKADTTDFAWGTIGTSIHKSKDGTTKDGIRFLTRVNMTAFDSAADTVTFKYEGETYTVKELGLLLKRAVNANELTVENYTAYASAAGDERIWGVAVYTADSNTFRLTDHTAGYIDYTIAMTTKNPSDAFNERLYTARGYLVLEKDGEETVLYANERTDSVNTAEARMNGEISDDVIVGGSGDNGDDVETPEVTVPADDKDYSNADLKVLSIGNSYSMNAQTYLAKIAETQGKTFKCVNLYQSGCSLQTHYNDWKNGSANYDYQLNGKKVGDKVTLAAVLASDTFDVITFQQASWSSVSYSNYQTYLNELIAFVREKQPGAKIYLHQTWAYGDNYKRHYNDDGSISLVTGGTMAAMWAKVEPAYNAAAAETGLSLIPVGTAVQYVQEAFNADDPAKSGSGKYSNIFDGLTGNLSGLPNADYEEGMYLSIQYDQAHLTESWGCYMAGRIWYEMFMGETPNVTLDQLNAKVKAHAAMEELVAEAAAVAFEKYPVDTAKKGATAA